MTRPVFGEQLAIEPDHFEPATQPEAGLAFDVVRVALFHVLMGRRRKLRITQAMMDAAPDGTLRTRMTRDGTIEAWVEPSEDPTRRRGVVYTNLTTTKRG